MSDAAKGRKHTAETKAKIGAASSARQRGVPKPHVRGDKSPMRRPEVAAKVSAARRGKPLTPEHRAKLSAAHQGKPLSEAHREALKKGHAHMRGDGNPMRRPEVAAKARRPRTRTPTYGGLHDRLDTQRGLATTHACEVCGEPAKDWALCHEAEEVETDARGRRYSLTLSDYIAMCRSCHRRYDRYGLSI